MSSTTYQVTGSINPTRAAVFSAKKTTVSFGIANQEELPNPAELLLGAFAACCLKNVQRFSELLNFDYTAARIEVTGERQEQPTKMIGIHYVIYVNSTDKKLNLNLLHKNIQKFGTIYNTLKGVCKVSGEMVLEP